MEKRDIERDHQAKLPDHAVRFKLFRKKLDISGKDLASGLGISASTITRIEKGTWLPSMDVINKLIKTYKMNPLWFYTGEGGEILDAAEAKDGSIIANIRTLKNNDDLLALEMKSLKTEFLKLYKLVHELKHSVQKRD